MAEKMTVTMVLCAMKTDSKIKTAPDFRRGKTLWYSYAGIIRIRLLG